MTVDEMVVSPKDFDKKIQRGVKVLIKSPLQYFILCQFNTGHYIKQNKFMCTS